jgi:hypothetical protein
MDDILEDLNNAYMDLEAEGYEEEDEDEDVQELEGDDEGVEIEDEPEDDDEGADDTRQVSDESDTDEGTKDIQKPEPVLAPSTWSADEKEWFNQQTPEAQAIFARRSREVEAHLTRKSRELSDVKRTHDAVVSSVGVQRLNRWHSEGVDAAQRLGALAELHDNLVSNPEGTIRGLMQQFGVSISNGTPSNAPGYRPAQAQQDPRVARLEQQVNQLSSESRTRHHNDELQTWRTVSDSFLNATDEFGNKLHPYALDMKDQIVHDALLRFRANPQADRSVVLKQAYHAVLAANPQMAKAVEDLRYKNYMSRQNGKVKKARAAATAVKGSGRATTSQTVPDDVHEHVRMVMSQLG